MTLKLITYGFLFHFMLVGVTEDQISQTCHSQVLGNFFMTRRRYGVSRVIKKFLRNIKIIQT